jgi:SAM-dependent methyltransferase
VGALASGTDTSRGFFESMYLKNADPWGFAVDSYELGRYQATSDVLSGRRYRRALEPGCSVGVLTEKLATLADKVVAFDISFTAVEQARKRCAGLGNVYLSQGTVEQASARECDLVVLSEIGYYFCEEELAGWSARLMREMDAGGVLLAVHWLGLSADHVLRGDDVSRVLQEAAVRNGLRLEQKDRQEHPGGGFRLEKWIKQ